MQVWYPPAIRGPRTAENAAGQGLSLARRSVDVVTQATQREQERC